MCVCVCVCTSSPCMPLYVTPESCRILEPTFNSSPSPVIISNRRT